MSDHVTGGRTPRPPCWRSAAAWILAVVAALLVPLAVTSFWLTDTIVTTDRYVATMAPLAQDRGFTDLLATRVTDAFYRALPPDVASTVGARRLRQPVEGRVAAALRSPAFQVVWDRANRRAHAQAMAVLTGTGTAGAGALAVNLTPLVHPLLSQLDRVDIHLFDSVAPSLASGRRVTVTIMSADQVREARALFGAIANLEWVLSVLAGVALVAAVAVATHRWRVLVGFALGTMAAVGLAFGMLSWARQRAVSRAAADHVDRSVAAQVFDILVRYLRSDLQSALLAAADMAALVAVAWGLVWVWRREAHRRTGASGAPGGGQTGRSATATSSDAASSSASGT
ncbi:MAG: hypothetical protein ACRDZR_07045 [Acidimicrobiales bacterium]